MIDPEKTARQGLDAARGGRVDEARELLAKLRQIDPRPILYWYALSQCRLRSGEFELAYNCLAAFNASLHAKHMQLLGLDEAQGEDSTLLSRLAGPEHILTQRRDADAHRDRRDFESASRAMSVVVDWRIGELESLGYTLFPR